MSTSAYPVQRRRRGPLRAVIITLIVLLAVLVVADRAVAYVAASKIAGQLQSRLGTSAEPQVSIAGFPLLTQAVAGTYERVQITATGVDAKELDKVDVRLDLREVRLPLSDALAGDVSHGRVGRADVAIDISEASLSTLTGLPITIDGLTDQVARLSTTFDVFGQKVPVSIDAMVIIEGTNARLDLQDASAAGIDLPGFVLSQLSDMVGVKFAVPTLVEGMHLDEVTARDGAVVLHASGTDVPFPKS